VYRFPTIRSGADGGAVLAWDDGQKAFDEMLELDTSPAVHMIRGARGAFTVEECRRIRELGEAQTRAGARVEGGDAWRTYRVGEIAWLPPQADTHWLYHRLAVLFNDVNRHYEFELLGLLDAPQYTVYGREQHFDWHIDIGPDAASLRKLSLSVQLSDGADYGGGELEFPLAGVTVEGQREIGPAIIFPSFLAHRVSPVTSGIRRSLVAWACGPTFR